MISVHHGDCRNVLPTLGLVADAVVTDPPYHLISISKRFANTDGSRELFAKQNPSRQFKVLSQGFMGQTWDGGDIARDSETWRTIADSLRPGGFLVAFGGSRTHHRMACAIEDAGFIIQDCLMWLYGTGFPKRRDHLKPAYEPIVLAYKPGGKRTLQVDECRIPIAVGDGWDVPQPSFESEARVFGPNGRIDARSTPHNAGRWPANICHDGSDEVVGLFPATTPSPSTPVRQGGTRGFDVGSNGEPRDGFGVGYGDSGSAARFFFSAKAGSHDRWGSRHPTVKPVELMRWLVALVCPPGGTVLDPFAGSGTTAIAALAAGRNAILVEREAQYVADIKERLAFYQGGGQHSMQAKHRNRPVDHGPLFAPTPLTPEEDAADSLASYNAAITAIGERVRAGEPVPPFMLRKVLP